MSKQQRSKGKPLTRAAKKPEGIDALVACANAQDKLTKQIAATRTAEDTRRQSVRDAYAQGHSAQDIADSMQVSRTKVYQLIGGAFEVKLKQAMNKA